MRLLVGLALILIFVIVAGVVGVLVLEEPVRRLIGRYPDKGDPGLTDLVLPEGYRANVFAQDLGRPRFMAVAPDGTLFAADLAGKRIVALPDDDSDGVADEVIEVGTDFEIAHSVAFTPEGELLVAATDTLYQIELDDHRTEVARRAILEYDGYGQHSTRTVVVTPDGSLLVSVGSSCNVCWEEAEERATIIAAPPEGGEWRVFMRGLRNAVGVAVDPGTSEVWAMDMGRDLMGDDLPPEPLFRVVDGADAGWPRCHAGDIIDPEYGVEPDPRTGLVGCEGVAQPAARFQAHMAPLGIDFWEGGVVLAFHGSWNRSSKVGYELLWLPWDDGPTGPPMTLVSGFLDPETDDASGRPAGVTVGADGALYVSDDKAGYIYRVTAPE